ncbi:hypothetical protein AOT53_004379 [Escherichia coli]|nr:hypothetical protein [Escherichia coli]EHL0366104.1 hypothetical protein [Escherichia coli]EHL0435796.1 hypothetical protein [Escherichia coli]EIG0653105.1 hypothetical protein [Escherichia coli]EIG5720462.1 hypothetical protein [Escherichia coli]
MHQVVSFSGGRTSAYLVHLMEAQRKAGASVHFIFMDMYRGHLTLDGIARMYADSDYRNLYQAMVLAKRFDTGSCSESCEIWGDQLELKFEEVVE